MNGLALDISLSCGWALGGKTGRPMSGVWRMPRPRVATETTRAEILFSLFSSVKATVQANGCEWACIEAPMQGIRHKNKRGITTPTSTDGTILLTMMSGVARAAAIAGGATRIMLPYPNEWRAAVLGNGYPAKPKDEALRYCELMKWGVTEHDAAEACCILVWGHSQVPML